MELEPQRTGAAMWAALYTGISSDPSGQRAGVKRQRMDCEAHCQTRGWSVVQLFEDNNASASGKSCRA